MLLFFLYTTDEEENELILPFFTFKESPGILLQVTIQLFPPEMVLSDEQCENIVLTVEGPSETSKIQFKPLFDDEA